MRRTDRLYPNLGIARIDTRQPSDARGSGSPFHRLGRCCDVSPIRLDLCCTLVATGGCRETTQSTCESPSQALGLARCSVLSILLPYGTRSGIRRAGSTYSCHLQSNAPSRFTRHGPPHATTSPRCGRRERTVCIVHIGVLRKTRDTVEPRRCHPIASVSREGAPPAPSGFRGVLSLPVPGPSQLKNLWWIGRPPTHRTGHSRSAVSQSREAYGVSANLHPAAPIPARIECARNHLVAEKAKIGGFLMNPSQCG